MSAAFENARKAILTYFEVGFVQPPPEGQPPLNPPVSWLPVSFPNFRIDQPKDANKNPLPWCRVSINEGTVQPREVGGGSTRVPGVLFLQIFIPENAGTRIARQTADLMVDLFQYQIIILPDQAIRFREVSLKGNLGAINGYDRHNIEVVFQRDAFKLSAVQELGQGAQANARVDAQGNMEIKNTTTGQFEYVAVVGEDGAEAVVPLGSLSQQQQSNVAVDQNGNLTLKNAQGVYETVAIEGAAGAEAVVVVNIPAGTKNVQVDGTGNLLLLNLTTGAYEYISIIGQPGSESIVPTSTL